MSPSPSPTASPSPTRVSSSDAVTESDGDTKPDLDAKSDRDTQSDRDAQSDSPHRVRHPRRVHALTESNAFAKSDALADSESHRLHQHRNRHRASLVLRRPSLRPISRSLILARLSRPTRSITRNGETGLAKSTAARQSTDHSRLTSLAQPPTSTPRADSTNNSTAPARPLSSLHCS